MERPNCNKQLKMVNIDIFYKQNMMLKVVVLWYVWNSWCSCFRVSELSLWWSDTSMVLSAVNLDVDSESDDQQLMSLWIKKNIYIQ